VSNKRILVAGVFGNALEFYDFTLYGVFAPIIASLFFPSGSMFISLLASWGAFAAGFIMRPFGASIFGYIGDRFGRQVALTYSILLMGLPTFIIALLPSYESIGIIAPVILILCRLLQGLCTGGEYNGAAIFSLEHLKSKYPGMAGGFITGSCVLGALVATGLSSLIVSSGDILPDYAWRIPFLLGAAGSFIGYWIRRHTSESPAFLSEQAQKPKNSENKTAMPPLLDAVKNYPASFLISAMCGGINGAMSYTLFGFLNLYLSRYVGIPISQAIQLNLIGLVCFMVSAPLMGYVYDRTQQHTYFYKAAGGVIVGASFVFFGMQTGNILMIALCQVVLGTLVGAIGGPQHAYLLNVFPVRSRYSGVSFSFCLGMAVLGGPTPMLLTYLVETYQSLLMPAFYLGLCSILFIVVLKVCQPYIFKGLESEETAQEAYS
jgi:MHS family proline/betaine transporter-like MFS transporter